MQKNAIKLLVKVWTLFQGGMEEIKEHFKDAEAEIKGPDLVGCRKSFDRFSFPRSSVGMPTGRSSGPNDPHKITTLERLNVLPRWSVGARRAPDILPERKKKWPPKGPFCLLQSEGLALDSTAAGGESDQTDPHQGKRGGFGNGKQGV